MRSGWLSLGIAVALVCGVAGCASGPELAAGCPTALPRPTWLGPSLRDTVLPGETMSPMEEAAAAQAPLSSAFSRIQQDFPADFAGARVGPEPMVVFKSSAPPAARTILAGAGRPVTVKENAGFNDLELHQAVVDAFTAARQVFAPASVSGGPDPFAGAVVVTAPMSACSLTLDGHPGTPVDSAEARRRIEAAVTWPAGLHLFLTDGSNQGATAG